MNAPAGISVLGIGTVTPLGRDINAIAQKLREPVLQPVGPFRLSDGDLADPGTSKRMRRADRFSRMAAIAAADAWTDAKPYVENVPPERVGLIVSTGFGPHVRGFKFL